MARKAHRELPRELPSDPSLLSSEFGGREDALREFEERLEEVHHDLERAFALRDHRAAAAQEARQAVETLTEKAHAAEGTNPDAAAKYRAHRQRKRTAYEEARRELQKAQAACERLGAERTRLEHNIAKLRKLRVRERRRRLWDRLRGVRDEDDTGAKANVHVPPYLIALGVGLAVLLGFMAIRYQSRGPAEAGADAPGIVTRVARLLGLGEAADSDLTQAESTEAASAAMKQMFGLEDPGPRQPPAQRLPVVPLPQLAQVDTVVYPWLADVEAYALPQRTWQMVVSDVAGDATPEIVFADVTNHRILIYERDAGGYILMTSLGAPGISSVAAGDMDGDGDTDLVAGSGGVGLWYGPNRGANSFELEPIHSRLRLFEVHVADLDGNGALDIVAGGQKGVHVCRGHGDGTFADPVSVLQAANQGRLVVADFNDDGILDVASLSVFGWNNPPESNELSVVLLGQNLAPLEPPKTRVFSPPAARMVAIDLDGGTGMDLAVMEHGDAGKRRLFSLWNSGSGRFDVAGTAKVRNGTGMVVEDFDGDGQDELLMGGFLYRNRGKQLAAPREPLVPASSQWTIRVDYDNDGVRDMVMNVNPPGTFFFLRGTLKP